MKVSEMTVGYCGHCGSKVEFLPPNEMGTEPVPICPKCGVLFFDDDVVHSDESQAALPSAPQVRGNKQ